MSTFKVTDMSCGHCEKTIKAELTKGHPEIKVSVDLSQKTVSVENMADEEVLTVLKDIGYTPEKMK